MPQILVQIVCMKKYIQVCKTILLAIVVFAFFSLNTTLAFSETQKKIGVYYGTFDPPHAGHRTVVMGAQKNLGLDLVYVVPFNKKSYKPDKTGIGHRVQMVAEHFRKDDQIEGLSPILQKELGQGDLWNLISLVSKEHPDATIYNIMGTDVFEWFKTLPSEKRIEDTVVVVSSRDTTTNRPKKVGRQTVIHIDDGAYFNSSTKIRKALKENGFHSALSRRVLNHIRNHGLYGTIKRNGRKNVRPTNRRKRK